jgi:Arc/MetJ family transcription regulator
MARTNIELDDHLLERGFQLTGARTKKELVNLALAELVRKEDQKSILALEGRIKWDGELGEMRQSRFGQ